MGAWNVYKGRPTQQSYRISQERMIESALARFGQENARLSWISLDASDGSCLILMRKSEQGIKKNLLRLTIEK
jgi:hypothetical protein